MAEGFSENATVDEGVNANGIRTQLHFEGDDLIVQKTFDAAPHLAHAAHAREQTQGMKWGEGRFVGHIPAIYYAPICAIKDPEQRAKAVRLFFSENPAFRMFDKYKP